MAANPPTDGRVFEEFDPPSEWAHEAAADTLVVYLPGFQKDKLKVQVTSAGVLRVLGERPLGGNKWRRFQKELQIPAIYDSSKISARFEGGSLYVRHPKLHPAPQVQPKPPTSTQAPKPEKPAGETELKRKPQEEDRNKPGSDKQTGVERNGQAKIGGDLEKLPEKKSTPDQQAAPRQTPSKQSAGEPARQIDANKEVEKRAADKGKEPLDAKESPAADQVKETGKAKVEAVGEEKGKKAGEKEEVAGSTNGKGIAGFEAYKLAVGNMVMELKKVKNRVTFILAVIGAVILFLYFTRGTRESEHLKNEF